MKTKWFAAISLTTFILTMLWLIFFIWDTAALGTFETFDQLLALKRNLGLRHYLIYAATALLTLCVPAFMVCLYDFCQPYLSKWARLAGLIYVPVYCALNLFAYLSQITIVPLLFEFYQMEKYSETAYLLLQVTLQLWPESAVAFFNGLAYAVLGIPSILFGLALTKANRLLGSAGVLLAVSGIASLLALFSFFVDNPILAWASPLSGVLFFLSLPIFVWGFLKVDRE